MNLWFDPGSHTFYSSIGLLLLRIGVAGMLLVGHGVPKMANFSNMVDTFPNPAGFGSAASLVLAIGAEVICAGLVAIGLLTRWAAVPVAVMLGTAAFLVHGADPWEAKEFALIYAVPFLTLFLTGAGRFSVDHRLSQSGLEGGIPGVDRVSDPSL